MPTRSDVLDLVQSGLSYDETGERLGIPAGQAYLIATGLPADGSDVLPAEDLANRPGLLEGSTQHLANPSTELPKHDVAVERWMKARATSDRRMQEAAAARTPEPPDIAGADETDDVISVLGWEHNQVKYLQKQLETIPGGKDGGTTEQQRQRASIVDMIRIRLSKHEATEEQHFWPAVRKALPDGDQLADTALEQEQEGKDLLHALEGMAGTEEKFDELVEQLVKALRKHVAFEDLVFLKVDDAMSDRQRAALGRKIRKGRAGSTGEGTS